MVIFLQWIITGEAGSYVSPWERTFRRFSAPGGFAGIWHKRDRQKLQTICENFAKISNGPKIARIAPISIIFWRNWSQRWNLSFEKVFRAARAQKNVSEKFFARIFKKNWKKSRLCRRLFICSCRGRFAPPYKYVVKYDIVALLVFI